MVSAICVTGKRKECGTQYTRNTMHTVRDIPVTQFIQFLNNEPDKIMDGSIKKLLHFHFHVFSVFLMYNFVPPYRSNLVEKNVIFAQCGDLFMLSLHSIEKQENDAANMTKLLEGGEG